MGVVGITGGFWRNAESRFNISLPLWSLEGLLNLEQPHQSKLFTWSGAELAFLQDCQQFSVPVYLKGNRSISRRSGRRFSEGIIFGGVDPWAGTTGMEHIQITADLRMVHITMGAKIGQSQQGSLPGSLRADRECTMSYPGHRHQPPRPAGGPGAGWDSP